MNFITKQAKEKPSWKVLVFPGGTEIGLEIRQSLAWCKEVQLFSVGSAVSNHAPYVFANHRDIPSIHEGGWLDILNNLIREWQITHIFPAYDDVLLALAENSKNINAKIITSPLETCVIARFKKLTINALKNVVPTPVIYDHFEEVIRYPVFVKPNRGQGSLNAIKVNDAEDLVSNLKNDPTLLISEYLPGNEYTVDCFSDRERGLLFASGRQRKRIRSGIAMDSKVAVDSRFESYAKAICSRLEFHGAWFFQVKSDENGKLKLLEVAPRIGGTSALTRARGVNLPLLSLFESERIPTYVNASSTDVHIDRAIINRFETDICYSRIYVDLDDALILRGRVNVELVKLIYQAINKNKETILLTRHAGDLSEVLRKHRLAGLFDKIIHIKDSSPKANFIDPQGAIFIDDSFHERRSVFEAIGVPVFDPSMVEMLFDERV